MSSHSPLPIKRYLRKKFRVFEASFLKHSPNVLFHVRNLQIESIRRLIIGGQVEGKRVQLLETEHRRVSLGLDARR